MDIQEQIDQLNRLVFSLHEVKPLTVEDIGKIVERCKGGSDDLDNLVTLCLWCHTSKHMGEPVYNLMASRPEIATIP